MCFSSFERGSYNAGSSFNRMRLLSLLAEMEVQSEDETENIDSK